MFLFDYEFLSHESSLLDLMSLVALSWSLSMFICLLTCFGADPILMSEDKFSLGDVFIRARGGLTL